MSQPDWVKILKMSNHQLPLLQPHRVVNHCWFLSPNHYHRIHHNPMVQSPTASLNHIQPTGSFNNNWLLFNHYRWLLSPIFMVVNIINHRTHHRKSPWISEAQLHPTNQWNPPSSGDQRASGPSEGQALAPMVFHQSLTLGTGSPRDLTDLSADGLHGFSVNFMAESWLFMVN